MDLRRWWIRPICREVAATAALAALGEGGGISELEICNSGHQNRLATVLIEST